LPNASWIAASNGLATTSTASFGTWSSSFCSFERAAAAATYSGSSTWARSSGCPVSVQAAAIPRMRPLSAFIAPRVASYGIVFDGYAHMLPSVIEPKPQAVLPPRVSTRQRTFSSVTRSTVRPPNRYGAR
jgi:hypothetical protein